MMITSRKFKIFFWVAICVSILLGTTHTLSTVTNDESSPLVISEFVAANQSGLTDEDGDFSDWIELHNRGRTAINLSGWSLTDDANDPKKWPLPDMTLDRNGYLVIFASGKDRRSLEGGSALHTNFRLRKSGDFLALYNVLDQRLFEVDSPNYPQQFDDFSYGLRPDEPAYNYFATPTPGGPNNTAQTWKGVASKVKFSLAHGFYEAPFQLELTTSTPGAVIRYTTDGSEPSEANGKYYSQPLAINSTTVVRATAFKPDYLPSTVDTQSYIFLAGELAQPAQPAGFPESWGIHPEEFKQFAAGSPVMADYEMDPDITKDPRLKEGLKSIPTISLVMDLQDFTDLYSNPRDRGPDWERPVSVEFINPNVNTEGFQVNAGLRMHGGVGRKEFFPKHSLRLLFKSQYGPAMLNYPLFPDSPVEEFNTLVLRGESDRSFAGTGPIRETATYTRDQWLRASQLEMSGVGSHGIFVHVYINGLYWGLYNLVERPDESFMASYFGGNKADWFVANQDGPLNRDSSSEWTDRLSELFINIGFQGRRDDSSEQPEAYSAQQFERVAPYIDTTEFSDYIILNWYAGTKDWPENNWYAGIQGPTSNGKYIVWDGQEIFENGAQITLGKISSARLNIVKPLFEILIQNADFKIEFADRFYKHLFNDGALTDANAQTRWTKINNTIDSAIIAESARWGDVRFDLPITRDDWLKATDAVLTQMEGNAAKLIALAREAGYYPQIDPPTFNHQEGLVTPDFELTMTAPEGTIYYTTNGSDPRASGAGAVASTAMIYNTPLIITSTTQIKARTLSAKDSTSSTEQQEWSALHEATFNVVAEAPNLAITEIMYNPLGGSDYEFIELKNVGDTRIDLSGMYFEGINYTFPTNSVLGIGGFWVLVRNPEAFAARYPNTAIDGVYDGNLANDGEQIILKDSQDKVIISVAYDDENGWPLSPDGRGDSLTLIDANQNPNNPKSWRASTNPYGSPGMDEP